MSSDPVPAPEMLERRGALPLVFPYRRANRRIVAFIADAAPIGQILPHISEPPRPLAISSTLGPPA